MIPPHGGRLVQKIVTDETEIKHLSRQSKEFLSITLDEEQVKELKNVGRGLYSPLEGYMNKDDFDSVVENMTLSDGTVWPIPLALDVSDTNAKKIHLGKRIALRNEDGDLIAVLMVQDIFTFDRKKTAKKVFKTDDTEHPGVAEMMKMHKNLIGGDILLIDNEKDTLSEYNLDPVETRVLFKEKKWETVVGFQTRNAPHRAHEYLQKCALEIVDGLFINPVIGKKKTGDFTDEAIIESYNTMIENYLGKDNVVLSILPLKMRYAGPREAVMHALIRKNFGCSHFVVGRDHAGVGDYYGTYDAQNIFDEIPDVEIEILKFEHSFYCEICNNMATSKTCPHDDEFKVGPSGSLIRENIVKKKQLPEEMIRPEVLERLQELDNVFVK